ncbi:Acyl-CoA reductase (LuxC) [Methylobacterium sp. 174MFSha1.1]|uniref:acyl-CoA reductase n=1 Tax=Methylobacterium sp. 174MFSha1.1 TaxID=1502749 RepID=UPI0008E2905A|nr:acyl-CoA reductase [Methylobacterium sp. 174MFSha1.1]SFV07270.1 Acyl-CoA reductase (LuxC) [Methylobacterium sp. 174MFSha1.1]
MSVLEQAGHLPGLPAERIGRRIVEHRAWGETVAVALPDLDEDQAKALCEHVRARATLRRMETARIVAAIDRASACLLDRTHPVRRKAEALLPVVTGYDRETVRLGLSSYLKTFRRPQLLRFLAEDFSNPGVLDGFQPAVKGGFVRARGPDLLLHVWAGNVPALPLWSLVSGLLVKAGSIGKLASAEPLTAGWFAHLIAEADPELGECLAVTWWKGGAGGAEGAFLGEADCIMAYGGNETLAALRAKVPVTTRFLPHGHRIGFAMVAREALDSRRAGPLARLAAQDIARYEQQGCYAPQMLFVERGAPVAPDEFARHLAHELAALASRHPRRRLDPGEAATIAAWRSSHEMRALDGGATLLGDPADPWSVVLLDAATALSPSGLNRSVAVVAVEDLAEVPALVAPHRAYLQTAGIAAAPARLFALAEDLAAVGVTRITAIGRMTAPEAGWHHDGRFSLLDLVTMTEIDAGAEAAAEGFAPYAD